MGDITWITQLTAAAYYAGALLALLLLRRHAQPNPGFYIGFALLFLSLALIRHFGLLDALTMLGRRLAMVEGWYTMRSGFRRQLIDGGIAGGLVLLLLLVWLKKSQLCISSCRVPIGRVCLHGSLCRFALTELSNPVMADGFDNPSGAFLQ